jgi:hypothetical protein
MLQSEVRQLSTAFGRLVREVSALRSVAAGIETLSEEVFDVKTQIAQKLNDSVVEQLSRDFIELRNEVLTLEARIAVMSPTVIPSQNHPPPSSPAPSHPLHLSGSSRFFCTLHSSRPFRRSIRGSFLTFLRSSQSSERSSFPFCGGAVAMVLVQQNFTADVTVTQTL